MRKKTVAAIVVLMMVLQFCFPTAVVLAEELNGEVEPGIEAVAEDSSADEEAPPEEEEFPRGGVCGSIGLRRL